MKKLAFLSLIVFLAGGTGWTQLSDPCVETSPPWTLCNTSFASGGPCGPGSAACGSLYVWHSDGSGNQNEAGTYQCGYLIAYVSYLARFSHDMGLPTPTGAGAAMYLRIAPAPVACDALCGAGTQLYSSNVHNCGGWVDSGWMTYIPPSTGSYCLIAVSCGTDGWSCGGATAIDDIDFLVIDPVDDWVLY
jgi:hypothetical protein